MGICFLFLLMFPVCSRKGPNGEDPYLSSSDFPPSAPLSDHPVYQIRDLTASIIHYDDRIRLLGFAKPKAPGDITVLYSGANYKFI